MGKRLSISLSDEDEAVLQAFTGPDSHDGTMLTDWARRRGLNLGPSPSEAAVLRALARVGAEALSERGLDAGYAAMAAELGQDTADSREARHRYARRTDAAVGP